MVQSTLPLRLPLNLIASALSNLASKTRFVVGEASRLGGEPFRSVLMVGGEPPLFLVGEFLEVSFDGLALDAVGEEVPFEETTPLASGSPLDRLRLPVAEEAFPFLVGRPRPIPILATPPLAGRLPANAGSGDCLTWGSGTIWPLGPLFMLLEG